MRRLSTVLCGALLAVLCSGCTMLSGLDWTGSELELKDAYKAYTRFIRWGELERASVALKAEDRDAFIAGMRDLGQLHVTDYEIDEIDHDKVAETATVRVRYRAFRPQTLEETTYLETQHWTRDLVTGEWSLAHEGPPLVPARSVGSR